MFGKINFWGNQTIGENAAGGEIVQVKEKTTPMADGIMRSSSKPVAKVASFLDLVA
jgi:hypothetical protein